MTRAELVEKMARAIRQHHRTHVRQPTTSRGHRRTFHQGADEAAQAALSIAMGAAAEVAAERFPTNSGWHPAATNAAISIATALRSLKDSKDEQA